MGFFPYHRDECSVAIGDGEVVVVVVETDLVIAFVHHRPQG